MIPTVILLSALLVWTSEAFSPKEEEKKTPEKELEAAIAKYFEGKKTEK